MSDPSDPLAAFKGILVGLLLGIVFWSLVAAVACVIW
jgi:hypothetical protein